MLSQFISTTCIIRVHVYSINKHVALDSDVIYKALQSKSSLFAEYWWEPPASFVLRGASPPIDSYVVSFSSNDPEFDFDPELQAALFTRVDRHARELAARTQTSGGLGWKSARHLIYALFHARGIIDELEKLRYECAFFGIEHINE